MQHQVFLHVTHSISDLSYGHIYISDSIGVNFSLSHKYNIKNDHNFCDFERIKAMEGIYIINYYEKEDIDRGRMELSRIEDSNEEAHSRKTILKSILKKKSAITFNKGASWTKIKPPFMDANGKPIDCKGTCSLHLHS